jgi:ESSS subunit of NADH:ubiquinone oxidoreductase (complex I)
MLRCSSTLLRNSISNHRAPVLSTTNRSIASNSVIIRSTKRVTNPNLTGRTCKVQQRRMGDDAHMPTPQSADAVLFGGHSPHPEGWETTIYIGYTLSLILTCGVLFFQPSTGIDNWANQEARARLKLKEEHGWTDDMFQFGVHYQNLDEAEVKEQWDKFSSKALKMTDDDDDDDEDE